MKKSKFKNIYSEQFDRLTVSQHRTTCSELCRTIKAVLFIMLALSLQCFADKQEYSKTLHKEYDTYDSTVLKIQNKFGDMVITNWMQNKVSIDVTITVEASSQEKANKIMDYINVSFAQDADTIKAITLIDKEACSNFYIKKDGGSQTFKIDYKVNIPVYLQMNLTNKYGNINIDEVHGKTNILLKYGKLIADKLLFNNEKPLSQISVSYGKGIINKITRSKIISGYSEFNIGESAALIMASKYSEIEIGNSKALVAESKYDEYKIGSINSIVVIGKYGDYKIKNINTKADFDVKYTNCNVENIAANFKEIKVDNSYGNFNLGIEPGASYNLSAICKYCNINYPRGSSVSVTSEPTEVRIKGNIGDDKTAASLVKINSRYGNVNLVKQSPDEK
ncbi:MAG: hypothetical protein HY738_05920 [Bacteroidia bacterium]|nr:hypothetical protein [Bacteroidia bacterium]